MKQAGFTAISLFVLFITFSTYFTYQKSETGILTDERASRHLGEVGLIGVAWLLSFPNSGTSYTLHLVRTATQTSVGTNYGDEITMDTTKTTGLVSIIPGHDNGPFYLNPLPAPNGGYILTKTHCTAFCVDCVPEEYVVPKPFFLQKCLEASRPEYIDGQLSLTYTSYNPLIVKRAVHLFRDPFDNIVARFRLNWKTQKISNNFQWIEEYSNNREGFLKWCAYTDSMWNGKLDIFFEEYFEPTVLSAFEGVPCHVEVYKYVQWHNMVADVLKDEMIPTLVMHYQDYEENLEVALYSLLRFLQLTQVSESVEPFTYFTHGDYFNAGDKLKVIKLIKLLATLEVWDNLSRYKLQKYLDEAEVK